MVFDYIGIRFITTPNFFWRFYDGEFVGGGDWKLLFCFHNTHYYRMLNAVMKSLTCFMTPFFPLTGHVKTSICLLIDK